MAANAGGQPGTSTPEKQALYDAFDSVLKAENERRAEEAAAKRAGRRRRISPTVTIGALLLVVNVAIIFVTRPPWLGFPSPYVETPVFQDASLRLSIYRARQQVERFRQANGALPRSLRDAGVVDTAVRMTIVSGSLYVLEGRNDSVRLALRSDEPVRPFLGSAYSVITGEAAR